MFKLFCCITLSMSLLGCAAHSPMILMNTNRRGKLVEKNNINRIQKKYLLQKSCLFPKKPTMKLQLLMSGRLGMVAMIKLNRSWQKRPRKLVPMR